MKIKRDGHLSWAIKAANHVGTREPFFGQKIWQMIETIIGLRVCYLENSGGTFPRSLAAGGSLLSLQYTREASVCFALRPVFNIWCIYPSGFSLGWNFLDTNKHFAKNLWTSCFEDSIFCSEVLLPALWESWVQGKATVTLVFPFLFFLATKYILY